MKVKCPKCQKELVWEETPTRPFCSERCKLIDLGAWADGSNSLPSNHDPSAEDERPQHRKDETEED
jgi:endogenous inhibitor of DNA gyrase (YacG/DUF329 family)